MNKMLHFIKSYALPLAMIIGGLFHDFFDRLAPLSPYLIFLMLFFSYVKIQLNNMRFRTFHFILLAIQILGSIGIYLLLRPLSEQIAQGASICIMAPTATAAIVVGGMLGANTAMMASYTMFCNFAIALMAPIFFSYVGVQTDWHFWESFGTICLKVIPILIFPFLTALFMRKTAPRFTKKIAAVKNLSFYLWLIALMIITGRIVVIIQGQETSHYHIDFILAGISLVICLCQFLLGRKIGSRYGEVVTGGQSLGQKNTILAIWMAQTYLDPVASIAPATYVLWQNIVNSYQLWRKERKEQKITQNNS